MSWITLSSPAIYSVELTAACTNRCPGCSNVYAHARPETVLSGARWRALLAPLLPEAVQIRLTGGEPTLHPDFFEILDFVTGHEVGVTVFTNGRWSDPAGFTERVRSRRRPVGLLVSLHGDTPESHEAFTGVPGSFAETVANLRLAVRDEIPTAISTVLTRQNMGRLEAVVELARTLGVRRVAFNRYLGPPRPEIEMDPAQMAAVVARIEALLRQQAPVKYGVGIPQCFALNHSEGCLAGVAYAAIDPWGAVRPCAHSSVKLGSLRESSIGEIWNGAAMNAWRAQMPAECPACPAYSICHGGCRAISELRPEQRDPLRNAPLCEYRPPQVVKQLTGGARPRPNFRIRAESFGYALLGAGHVVPVSAAALPLLQSCDGRTSFAQLVERFGEAGLNLLGELWEQGLLKTD